MTRLITIFKHVNNLQSLITTASIGLLGLCVIPFYTSAQVYPNVPATTDQQTMAASILNPINTSTPPIKNLSVRITKLVDNQGQVYLGALVSKAELTPYLSQLKGILSTEFKSFRANQAERDHQTLHMTLINPIEYRQVDQQLVEQLLNPTVNTNVSPLLKVKLLGLGKVEKDDKRTYFIVAESQEGQFLRQHFLLSDKDFHVTLGFEPSDIYGVKKDASTLIY